MSHISDLIGVLRGLKVVIEAGVKVQEAASKNIWNNSNLKPLIRGCSATNPLHAYKTSPDLAKDVLERAFVVAHGFRQYATMHVPNFNVDVEKKTDMDPQSREEIEELNREFNKTFASLKKAQNESIPVSGNIVAPLESITPNLQSTVTQKTKVQNEMDLKQKQSQELSKVEKDRQTSVNVNVIGGITPKPVNKKKIRVSLSGNSKARVVPSSRIKRMISFGSLAVGLGIGTVAQFTRNTVYALSGEEDESSNAFLSTSNAERIVDTLCKVRGAALKLGQLLSIQDDTMLSPELQRIFERVRQSADFMPVWQVENVMKAQLGHDWRNRLQSFEEKPFAAASIEAYEGILTHFKGEDEDMEEFEEKYRKAIAGFNRLEVDLASQSEPAHSAGPSGLLAATTN